MDRTILHCDMNNFYASVECLYRPELRDKPVAVVGDAELRHGIVLAKNYLAKQCGVATGNPLWMAKQLCRDIVFVGPHFDRYLRFSKLARELYGEYTDQVESFGLDECWLDVSGSRTLFGDGQSIADELRRRIRYELGITASVGVSYNKIFAKLGSDMKKPDATTVIPRCRFQQILWQLPVSDLLYVGPATTRKLGQYCIRTIGDLAKADPKFIKQLLGKVGTMLWGFANGHDISPVTNAGIHPAIKSIGNSTTTPRDLCTDEEVKITLYILCESIAERLREQNFECSTVQISVRNFDLYSYERQVKLEFPVSNSESLFQAAFSLYQGNQAADKPVRSLGVRACNLSLAEHIQLSFVPEAVRIRRQDDLESAVDSIRRRFGHFSVQRGIALTDPELSYLDPKNDHIIHPVGFLNHG